MLLIQTSVRHTQITPIKHITSKDLSCQSCYEVIHVISWPEIKLGRKLKLKDMQNHNYFTAVHDIKVDILTFQTIAKDYNFVIPFTRFGFVMTYRIQTCTYKYCNV